MEFGGVAPVSAHTKSITESGVLFTFYPAQKYKFHPSGGVSQGVIDTGWLLVV